MVELLHLLERGDLVGAVLHVQLVDLPLREVHDLGYREIAAIVEAAAALARGGGDEPLLFHAPERDVDATALEHTAGTVNELQTI